MIYEYNCLTCGHVWEANFQMSMRDQPCSQPCPSCEKEGGVKRALSAPPLNYNGGGLKSSITRAGSGWNDVLNRVKKASGRSNTIITK